MHDHLMVYQTRSDKNKYLLAMTCVPVNIHLRGSLIVRIVLRLRLKIRNSPSHALIRYPKNRAYISKKVVADPGKYIY